MRTRALLMTIVTMLTAISLLANPSSLSLEEYCGTLLRLKQGELVRLQNGETGVEGYALFGAEPPAYLLRGDPWADQLVATASRMEVLALEIASLEYVLSQLRHPTSDEPHGDITLTCTADSHVYAYSYSGWNQANFGRYEHLGAGWHPTGGEKRTYVRFDLSGIDPASVSQATLRLYHYHTGSSDGVALGVHRVTSPWTEGVGTYRPTTVAQPGEIAWVHQPSFDATAVVDFRPGTEIGKWIEVDVTPLVVGWLAGTPNHGLVIKAVGALSGAVPHSEYGFYAREDEEGRGPVLVLSGASDPAEGFDQARALLCASDEEFIRSLYHCITHREPTAQEVEAQVGLLHSGTLRRNMVQYFFASPGYVEQNHDGVRFITDACQAIYGRQPSDAELTAWPRTQRSVIVIDMLDSPEHLAATQACAGLWRRDVASNLALPYVDDFSSGLAHWDVSKVTLQEADGALMWQSGNHLPVSWRHPIPMEDVVIEFDGWCEKNGLGVMWINEESVGYFATLGGWFNARSCSDGCIRGFGLPAEQREYVDGAHIQLGRWQHYRLVRSGDWLDFYVDGTRVIHRQILHRYEGQGTLTFASYGSVVGIANLRIYRANGQERSAAEGVLRAGADPEDAPVLGHQQPAEAVVAVSHPEPVRRHTISFLGVLGIVGLLAGAALVVVLALLQA